MVGQGKLDGRIALVTGASQGIGLSIVQRLVADGAEVALNGRGLDNRLLLACQWTGAFPAPADIADQSEVFAMVENVERNLGKIDTLVANHAYMSMAPLVEHEPEDWWRVVDTNLGGTFSLVQAVLPGMRRRGYGRIILISSEWGVTGWSNATAYAASKAGLIAMAKCLGRELAPDGIIVNAVAPGVIDTPQLEVDARDAGVSRADIVESYAADIPLRRVGTAQEVAAVVSMLADPRLSALVGQVIQANGGTTRTRG